MDKVEKETMGYRIQILLFAGTTEGRLLADAFRELPAQVYVSTATQYGKECVMESENVKVMAGRMDEKEIARFIEEHGISLAVDATHPFAEIVTANIRNACQKCNIEYIRCLREAGNQKPGPEGDIVFTDSVENAVEFLKATRGNILIATGSKELSLYTEIEDYQARCYARVLSTLESVRRSTELGFQGAHLIAMQGPFGVDINKAILRHIKASYFVTKESGKTGGFEEKLEAARQTGAVLVAVGRPRETGLDVEQTKAYVAQKAAEA